MNGPGHHLSRHLTPPRPCPPKLQSCCSWPPRLSSNFAHLGGGGRGQGASNRQRAGARAGPQRGFESPSCMSSLGSPAGVREPTPVHCHPPPDTRIHNTEHCKPRLLSFQSIIGARSVVASYKPPMLVTRVRLPACAFIDVLESFMTLLHWGPART